MCPCWRPFGSRGGSWFRQFHRLFFVVWTLLLLLSCLALLFHLLLLLMMLVLSSSFLSVVVALLLLLYTLQGVPMGLSASAAVSLELSSTAVSASRSAWHNGGDA